MSVFELLDRAKWELAEFYTDDEARIWLESPQKLLGGKSPMSMITSGNSDEVFRVIAQLRDGAYV